MSPSELIDDVTASPFRPFRMRLSNGIVYDIDNPGLVLVGNRFLQVGIPASPDDPIADRYLRIDPIHVAELIPMSSPPAVGGNGHSSS